MIVRSLAAGLVATEPPASQAEKPTEKSTASKPQESLDVRYARAALEMAKLEVEKLDAANRKVRATYAESTIEPLRQIVAISEAQLDAALGKAGRPDNSVAVRRAEARLRTAQTEQARGAARNRNIPGIVGPLGLKRLEAAVNLARIGLEKARAEPGSPTLEQLDWRLTELEKEILQVRSRIDQMPGSASTLDWWR